jgi:TRAP transporter TAXI family solute receptor
MFSAVLDKRRRRGKEMKKTKIFVIWLAVAVVCFIGMPFLANTAPAKPITHVKIAGGRVGDPWYVLSQAWADFINKKSKWLRAEVVATPGITGSAEVMRDNPKDYLSINCLSVLVNYRKGPFGQKRGFYRDARFIANAAALTQLLVTYDPKIKTPADLKGKKVGVGRKGASDSPNHEALLREWGVLDTVTLVHGGIGGRKARLMDGLADAVITICEHIYPREFRKGAFITEMETRKPLRYISLGRDKLVKLRKEMGGFLPVRVPAGALDPKTQPDVVWADNNATFFSADVKMDPEIVYEATRVIWETAGQWGRWHPQGKHMTREFIRAMVVADPTLVHPGAKKFFDERGIKMTDLAELLR